MTQLEQTLLAALKAASDHLDYCGYGDSYERECAHDEKLPERIADAIALGETAQREMVESVELSTA